MKPINRIYKMLGLPIEEVERRDGTVYLRKRAESKDDISKRSTGQLITNIRFGEVAQKARGKKGIDEEYNLPHAAAEVARSLTNTKIPDEVKKKRIPKWVEEIATAPPETQELLRQLLMAKAEDYHVPNIANMIEMLSRSREIPERIKELHKGLLDISV